MQFELKIKIAALIMLTYNVDVLDSLTNGAIRRGIGFEKTPQGTVKTVLVSFKSKKCGREKKEEKLKPTYKVS